MLTLAVDFGTSNSLVGAWKDGKRVEALPIDSKSGDPTLMRTLLHFPTADICFYGSEAIENYIESGMEGRFFRSFKSHLPNRNYLGTFVESRVVTLENLVGIFLLELKKRAEKILGAKAENVVIGRPARYSMDAVEDEFAIHRMQKAAEFAGFKNIVFTPEPLAAALDYRRQIKSEKLVLIGDFGGGTSDFTLIKMGPFAYKKEHVLGIEGCALAGDALDSLFMSKRLSEFFGSKARYKIPLGSNILTMPPAIMTRLHHPAHIVHLKEKATYEFIQEAKKCSVGIEDQKALQRLLVMVEDQQIFSFFEKIEKTKRHLSEKQTDEFVFDYPGIEVQATFQQKQFVDWAVPIKEKIFKALDECLKQGNISEDQVDLICLTGGSAKVPLIQSEFAKRFGPEKLKSQSHFHSVLSGLIESASMISE
jgi:hypothetical chaperone protein